MHFQNIMTYYYLAHNNAIQCHRSGNSKMVSNWNCSLPISTHYHHNSNQQTQLDLFLDHSMSYRKAELLCVIFAHQNDTCNLIQLLAIFKVHVSYLGSDIPVFYIPLLLLGCQNHWKSMYPKVHCYNTLLSLPPC